MSAQSNISISGIVSGNGKFNSSAQGGGSTLWIVPKAQQYSAKLPLYAFYPRPTAEVNSFACHLWAHSTMTYELVLGAQFGCWPYQWSLSGLPGATIGAECDRSSVGGLTLHTPSTGYGKIVFSGAKSGTYSVSATCKDQLGTTVSYSWTITVDDTKFFFVDPAAANDSGTGTFASPKKLFSSSWVSGNTAKTLVLRTGTHTAADTGSDVGLSKTTRPTAIINYPGETPIIDCATKMFRDGAIDGGADDFVLRGCKILNCRSTDNDVRVIHTTGAQNRMSFTQLQFSNIVVGAVGTDNPGCIIVFKPASASGHLFISGCSLDSTCKSQLTVYFWVNRSLVELNTSSGVTFPSSNGSTFINGKDSIDNACIRANTFIGSSATPSLRIMNQSAAGTNQEICWNTVVSSTQACTDWSVQNTTNTGGGPFYDYANTYNTLANDWTFIATYYAAHAKVGCEGRLLVPASGYATYSNGLGVTSQAGMTIGTVADQQITSAQLDATGKLTGTGTTYRLTQGAELFSS